MECHGMHLDAALLLQHRADVAGRMDAITRAAHAAAGRSFNLASPLQLSEVLYEGLRLRPPGGAAGGKTHASTDEGALAYVVLVVCTNLHHLHHVCDY